MLAPNPGCSIGCLLGSVGCNANPELQMGYISDHDIVMVELLHAELWILMELLPKPMEWEG